MGRDYVECGKCGDLLPEWMDGTWTCSCGDTTIEVDLSVDCSGCGKSVKEHEAAMVSYSDRNPSGGGLRTELYFCGECDPAIYQVAVIESEGRSIPVWSPAGYQTATCDTVASWLAAMNKGPLVCGCGEREWVGVIVVPDDEAADGDMPLVDGWSFRPACLGCMQAFKAENGLN